MYLNKYKKEAYAVNPFGNYLPLSSHFVGKHGAMETDRFTIDSLKQQAALEFQIFLVVRKTSCSYLIECVE